MSDDTEKGPEDANREKAQKDGALSSDDLAVKDQGPKEDEPAKDEPKEDGPKEDEGPKDDPQEDPKDQEDPKGEIPKDALPDVRMYEEPPTRSWPDPDDFLEQDAAFKGKEFTEIGVKVPVLMLPVRLETRIDLKNEKLRIRVFPDQLNVQKPEAALSQIEQGAGAHFWGQFKSAPDHASRRAVLEQLIQSVGPRRVGHIIEQTDPEQEAAQSATAPLSRADPQPRLVALPRRWIVMGHAVNGMGFYAESKPLNGTYETGISDKTSANTSIVNGVPVTADAKWMVDFEDAKERGMALEIDLRSEIIAAGEISSMIVFGVEGGKYRKEDAEQIKELLAYHERSSGLGFMPQGSITNNIQGSPTEWTFQDSDLEQIIARLERDTPAPQGSNADELQSLLGLGEVKPLARARHASHPERHQAKAMNRALFEACLGRFMRDLMPAKDDVVRPDAIEGLRDWFIENVTGGAPVCTLRVGAQPYGILPVTPLKYSVWSLPIVRSVEGYVENIVTVLRQDWIRALDQVPLLDPNAIDRQAAHARPASSIPALLASQPHPARLFRRALLADQNRIQEVYDAALEALAGDNPDLYDLYGRRRYAFENAKDIDQQIAVWGRLHFDALNLRTKPVAWRKKAMQDVAAMLAVLGRFEQRQRPLKSLKLPHFEGAIGKPLSAYLAAEPDNERHEYGEVPLVSLDEKTQGIRPQTYLASLAKSLREWADKGGGKKWTGTGEEAPPDLLYALIVSGFDQFGSQQDIVAMAEALDLLASTASAADLDRLARETLGLGSHRLDAWYTSLATARIKRMRSFEAYKTGLSLGAYGWLTDLKFGNRSASSGFMHAPSLPLAATAAVLRSGYLAHGSTEAASPAAIDASSGRVRLAHEILGGVRNGQAVGTLLGYRFERGLKDAQPPLSGLLRDVRQMVINETETDATLDEPVDGMALLELYKSRKVKPLTLLANKALQPHYLALAAIFDAVHDVALFEGTHAATTGKTEHAAAVFEAINQGSQLPPEFRAQTTDRHGLTIDHRLMLLFGADTSGTSVDSGGWHSGLRDQLAPELERWLRQVLPNPAETGFYLEGTDLTLADLNLSALDAIYLMDEDPTGLSAALLSVAAQTIGHRGDGANLRSLAVDLTKSSQKIGLEEFQLMAIELRAMLDASSPLDANGLSARGTTGKATRIGTAQSLKRVQDLADRLAKAIDAGDWALVARFGIAGGTPKALVGRARRLLEQLLEKQQAGHTAPQDMAAHLFGRATPVLVAFTMPETARGDAPVTFYGDLDQEPGASDWLDSVGAVRPLIGRLSTARMLGDMLGGNRMSFDFGQDKRLTNEGWAAISRPPKGTGGRLSVVALRDQKIPKAGQSAVGLMLDQWSERIPADEQMTGVSFQFDAPSSKPPQAMLLAAPHAEFRSWRVGEMARTLYDTLQFAALRMVEPEDLTDFGAVLPTIYAKGLGAADKEAEK